MSNHKYSAPNERAKTIRQIKLMSIFTIYPPMPVIILIIEYSVLDLSFIFYLSHVIFYKNNFSRSSILFSKEKVFDLSKAAFLYSLRQLLSFNTLDNA